MTFPRCEPDGTLTVSWSVFRHAMSRARATSSGLPVSATGSMRFLSALNVSVGRRHKIAENIAACKAELTTVIESFRVGKSLFLVKHDAELDAGSARN